MRSPLIPFLYFLYLDQKNRVYTSLNEYFNTNDIVKIASLYAVTLDNELKTYLALKEILINEGLARLIDEIYSNPLKYSEVITSSRQTTINNTLIKILEAKKRIGDFFLEKRRITDALNTYSSIIEWLLSYILKRYISVIDGLQALAKITNTKELMISDYPSCLPGKPCSIEGLVGKLDIDAISSVIDHLFKDSFILRQSSTLRSTIRIIEKNRIKRIVAEKLGIENPIIIMAPSDIEEFTDKNLTENKIIIYNNLDSQVNKIIEDLALVGGVYGYNLIPLYSNRDNYSIEKLLKEFTDGDINEINIIPSTIINSLEQAIRILPMRFTEGIHVKLFNDQLDITYANKEIDIILLTEDIRKELGSKIPIEKSMLMGVYIIAKTILY